MGFLDKLRGKREYELGDFVHEMVEELVRLHFSAGKGQALSNTEVEELVDLIDSFTSSPSMFQVDPLASYGSRIIMPLLAGATLRWSTDVSDAVREVISRIGTEKKGIIDFMAVDGVDAITREVASRYLSTSQMKHLIGYGQFCGQYFQRWKY